MINATFYIVGAMISEHIYGFDDISVTNGGIKKKQGEKKGN